MHPALEAAYAKRDRAREHLETLEMEADEFLGGYPYRVSVDLDAERRWYIASVEVIEEPPPRLSILLGEIAYECISALNHLVWELAARKQGRKRVLKIKRSIQFPVCTSARHLAQQALVKDRLVSRDAMAVLAALQPYETLYGSYLRLNETLRWVKDIADTDKHRVLARGFGELVIDELEWEWDETHADGPIEEGLLGWDEPIDHGTKIGRIRFRSGHRHAAVHVDRQPGADVLFDTGVERVRIRNMEGALEWLDRRALPAFASLFPD